MVDPGRRGDQKSHPTKRGEGKGVRQRFIHIKKITSKITSVCIEEGSVRGGIYLIMASQR